MKRFRSEAAFRNAVRRLAMTTVKDEACQIDIDDELPAFLRAEIAAHRLLAFESIGHGRTRSLRSRSRLIVGAIRDLARGSASVAKYVMDQNLGQVHLLRDCVGSDVWSGYRKVVQTGEKQVAFLMTEPHSGSSARRFRCAARKVSGGYRITGTKDWITGAEWRLLWLVVAKVSRDVFGLFLIDRTTMDQNGHVAISPRKRHLGLHGLGECRVMLKDVFVPRKHVVLGPSKTTLRRIMQYYSLKRCGQAAMAIGLSEAALSDSYEYLRRRCRSRTRSGLPFQCHEFAYAEMVTLIRASVQLNAWALECAIRGLDARRKIRAVAGEMKGDCAASSAKLFCTESAVKITNWAIQLCGANGLLEDFRLERYLRDAKTLTIAGGTSEILRTTIAGQLPRTMQVSG